MKNFGLTLLAAATALGISSGAIWAGETVSFQGPPIQPTPFKVKRALAKGIVLEPKPGMELQGYLARPKGAGPFPAIVLLVSGTGQQPYHLTWADELSGAGYVTLVVDSYGSRGGTSFLDIAAMDMTIDAFISYSYLSGRDDVDGNAIGLLGFSAGAAYAQSALSVEMTRRPDDVNFKAAVTFYPTCEDNRHMNAPVLILAGDKDDLMSLGRCAALVENTSADEFPATMHVYQDVTHFFDNPDYARDASLRRADWQEPIWYQDNAYNSGAHADAQKRTTDFFAEHLR